MRAACLIVLLLAALSAVNAAEVCKRRGYKSFPIRHGRISSSFEASGEKNHAPHLIKMVVEEKGEKKGCQIVGIKPQQACSKRLRRDVDRGRVWDTISLEFRAVVTYKCKGRPAKLRYQVTATSEATVRTWGSSMVFPKKYTERRI